MGEPPLSDYEVVRFLVKKGGRCTNYELVSNFRGILNDPQHQAEARLKFKDIINTVATVGEYQNVKYIELKKEYCLNNYIQHQPEDVSGHSSLSSETSGSSTYSSPQNFQPYWRYRLSTSKQVPPSTRTELDTFLQSLPTKTPIPFSRSVSESTLPQDKASSRTNRSSSVEKHDANVQSLNSLGWSREEDYRKFSGRITPDRKFSPGRPPDSYASGHRERPSDDSIEQSRSLSYYGPDSSPEQGFREGQIGLPLVKRNSHVLENSPRAIEEWLNNRSRGWKNEMFQEENASLGHHECHLNRNISIMRHRQNRNDNTIVRTEQPIRLTKNSHIAYSPSKLVDHHEVSPLSRNEFIVPRSATSLRTESQRCIENNDNDVFVDPDYIRTVSKLCLEKSKGHRGPASSREPQFTKSELSDACNKATESVTNQDSELSRECSVPSLDIPTEDERVPVPPERRRRSQVPVDLNETTNSQSVIESWSKVRDRVQHFDEMEKKQNKGGDKENNKGTEDDVSISVLDSKLKREWFVKASQCDYHALVVLLKKEPKLAALKDIASGYTALHWAAKQGDANVVKLIAGAYKVNPNTRSNGGYTPVHLASLYKHEMIGHLLIHTYGADSSLRDYSGKRADQYPNNYIRVVAGYKHVERRPLKQRCLAAKETSSSSFMRIGSLNLRKARKSTVFASVRGRNWGSASELRLGSQGSTRKKMHKNLHLDKKCVVEKKNDSDSDSAYGFASKKQE